MTDDERERAWAALHDAMTQMPGWAVGPCVYHDDGALWQVAAVDLPFRAVLRPSPRQG